MERETQLLPKESKSYAQRIQTTSQYRTNDYGTQDLKKHMKTHTKIAHYGSGCLKQIIGVKSVEKKKLSR